MKNHRRNRTVLQFCSQVPAAMIARVFNDADPAKDAGLSIVTTFYPMYEFTKEVVGDAGEVSLLIPAGIEPNPMISNQVPKIWPKSWKLMPLSIIVQHQKRGYQT